MNICINLYIELNSKAKAFHIWLKKSFFLFLIAIDFSMLYSDCIFLCIVTNDNFDVPNRFPTLKNF